MAGDAVDELDESKWQQTIDVNLKGVYACCHFGAKLMKPQGSGCIVSFVDSRQRGEAFHSPIRRLEGRDHLYPPSRSQASLARTE